MADPSSFARLPFGLNLLPLSQREGPYLELPGHLAASHERNAKYRSILPVGAKTSRGTPHKAQFLRRYAFEALLARAEFEVCQLRALGELAKALRWEQGISKAREAYGQDIDSRRDLYFDALDRQAMARRPPMSQPLHMHEENEADDSEAGNMRRAIRESISTHASESMNARETRGADIKMADDSEDEDTRQAINESIATRSSHYIDLEETEDTGRRVPAWSSGALKPQQSVIELD
jgi:hypothetical protein